MKRLLTLLLCCLLLCGCAQGSALTEDCIPRPAETGPKQLYHPGTEVERRTGGAVAVYPVTIPDAKGILPLGENLLLFSGDTRTRLTLLSGNELTVSAQTEPGGFPDWQDGSFVPGEQSFSFYDAQRQEILEMDDTLQVQRHIAVPEDLIGSPILDSGGNTVYYCTSEAVRAWDLKSGRRRTVLDLAGDSKTLSGLYLQDRVLGCTVTDRDQKRTLFLSTENGQLLYRQEGPIRLHCSDSRYGAVLSDGTTQTLVFGPEEGPVQSLMPAGSDIRFFPLPGLDRAVSVQPDGETQQFDLYDLDSGKRLSSVALPGTEPPAAVTQTNDGNVYILMHDEAGNCETLYRWLPEMLPITDETVYTGTHFTAENPDTEGLARCQARADSLSETFGIRIRIWKNAVEAQPWDYDLEAEHRVNILEDHLALLEEVLSQYPSSMLTDTAAHFSSLSISLVRQIRGTAESGSLNTATGVQFLDGTDAHVAIAVGSFARQALYHELFHVMETHILTHSIAFDSWNALNPRGFSYDYSYLTNAERAAGVYLQKENRAFVDTYSMSYPKEDRARIMEYAMLPGNRELFRPPVLQRKLQALCDGIREAYSLRKYDEVFLWEQYLE